MKSIKNNNPYVNTIWKKFVSSNKIISTLERILSNSLRTVFAVALNGVGFKLNVKFAPTAYPFIWSITTFISKGTSSRNVCRIRKELGNIKGSEFARRVSRGIVGPYLIAMSYLQEHSENFDPIEVGTALKNLSDSKLIKCTTGVSKILDQHYRDLKRYPVNLPSIAGTGSVFNQRLNTLGSLLIDLLFEDNFESFRHVILSSSYGKYFPELTSEYYGGDDQTDKSPKSWSDVSVSHFLDDMDYLSHFNGADFSDDATIKSVFEFNTYQCGTIESNTDPILNYFAFKRNDDYFEFSLQSGDSLSIYTIAANNIILYKPEVYPKVDDLTNWLMGLTKTFFEDRDSKVSSDDFIHYFLTKMMNCQMVTDSILQRRAITVPSTQIKDSLGNTYEDVILGTSDSQKAVVVGIFCGLITSVVEGPRGFFGKQSGVTANPPGPSPSGGANRGGTGSGGPKVPSPTTPASPQGDGGTSTPILPPGGQNDSNQTVQDYSPVVSDTVSLDNGQYQSIGYTDSSGKPIDLISYPVEISDSGSESNGNKVFNAVAKVGKFGLTVARIAVPQIGTAVDIYKALKPNSQSIYVNNNDNRSLIGQANFNASLNPGVNVNVPRITRG